MSLRVAHIALGGCLRASPVRYGLTADTGGHIAYVLAAAAAQADTDRSIDIALVTRRFDDPRLGAVHLSPTENVSPNVRIERIGTHDRRYLEKEALAAELPGLTRRFLFHIERAARRPSVIHAHFADAAAMALAAREAFAIPFVFTPHALALDKGDSGRTASARIEAERRAIETADAIIVSSHDEAERQIAAYGVAGVGRRTFVMPPGAPPHCREACIMPPLVFDDPRRPMVLAIARPTRKKNLVAVAEAFAASRLRELANLVIVAGQHDSMVQSPEERDVIRRLQTIAGTAAMAGRMALPPRHGSADVRALYRAAARSGGVFVSPALHEPFGLTLLEAAAAGLPVVATAHGGAADIVRRIGHGLVVEPRDRAAIAAACLRVIEHRDLRQRLVAASAGHARRFSWDRYARDSLALYSTLAAAAERRGAVAA